MFHSGLRLDHWFCSVRGSTVRRRLCIGESLASSRRNSIRQNKRAADDAELGLRESHLRRNDQPSRCQALRRWLFRGRGRHLGKWRCGFGMGWRYRRKYSHSCLILRCLRNQTNLQPTRVCTKTSFVSKAISTILIFILYLDQKACFPWLKDKT